MKVLHKISAFGAVAVWAVLVAAAAAEDAGGASRIARAATQASGRGGGLCVHLGAMDGQVESALGTTETWLVQGLTLDREALLFARGAIQAKNLYGAACVVKVESFERLPYVDNLINLVIADVDAFGDRAAPRAEIMRILAPGGVAYLKTNGRWDATTKPWPEQMDQWTHANHGADGNLVSGDRLAGAPGGVQWLAGPLYPAAERKSSTQVMVTAGGRIFYITQNAAANVEQGGGSACFLIARDALNGLLLWQQRYNGPLRSGSSLVATPDRLFLIAQGKAAALDAATGQAREIYATSQPARRIVHSGGRLIVETADEVSCFDPASGKPQWRCKPNGGFGSSAASMDSVYFVQSHAEGGAAEREVVCLDLPAGRAKWRAPLEKPARPLDAMPSIVFAQGGHVGCLDRGMLHVLKAESGRAAWSRETRGAVFCAGGLVWTAASTGWVGADPATGAARREAIGASTLGTTKCQRAVATERFILNSRQMTLVWLEDGRSERFGLARGGCGYGFAVGNGLTYTFPHACLCFPTVLRGFMALTTSHAETPLKVPPEDAMEKGPAVQRAAADADTAADEDWPAYRHDARRSAFVGSSIPQQPTILWSASANSGRPARAREDWRLRVSGRVTSPIVAAGRVYVADCDAHCLVAMDADSGKVLWRYTADARITAPPTISGGRCIFGSQDGRVHCLWARDGAMIWHRRLAPSARSIVAYGQLESIWPVMGSVLAIGDVAYAAVGRSPSADGGVVVHGLDLQSGQVLWSEIINSARTWGDTLVADDHSLYLFDRKLERKSGKSELVAPADDILQSGIAGLTEATWTRLSAMGTRSGSHNLKYRRQAGQPLAFSAEDVWGCRDSAAKSRMKVLFAAGKHEWTSESPQVEALVATQNAVLTAGPIDPGARQRGGFIRSVRPENGEMQWEMKTASPPVYQGLAVARGRLYIACEDATVLCLGAKR